MFTLLEAQKEIAKAQSRLEVTIRREFNRKLVKNIGYPGGTTYDAKVFTDGHYWFWSADRKGSDTQNPRRLNSFGLFGKDVDLQITVEINIHRKGAMIKLQVFSLETTPQARSTSCIQGVLAVARKALARPPSWHGVIGSLSTWPTHPAVFDRACW